MIPCAAAIAADQEPAPAPSSTAAKPLRGAPTTAPQRIWLNVPRTLGRLSAADIGLVINTSDPYSVEVGEFYIAARKLKPKQVLRVELPVKAVLTPEEFGSLALKVEAYFGNAAQAVALAWTQPYAVNCNSITAALTMGYDGALCAQTCAPSRPSLYFNSVSVKPQADMKMRLSMLLAARDVAAAKAMIERGVASDHSLGLRGAPPAHAHYVITNDKIRSVRAPLFPPPGLLRRFGVEVHVEETQALDPAQRVLLYQTGLTHVAKLDTVRWVAGAVADHLTSTGGVFDGTGGQMTSLAWISSGATASYGSVSEPCSHVQKFPHPQVLLLHYMQGASVIEAYWKSVAWPQQGVFIGEPLAAPFSR
ncbi:MAG: TIGR03790 family protein [Pseudorhodobacter sp.]|nr:TIGR03790 family protein [Rhizobacter sp.]